MNRPLPSSSHSIVGLLPWQSYFLAFSFGIFSYRYSVPALVALSVLVVADTTLRGRPHRLPVLAFALCAALGFGYAAQSAVTEVSTPSWMEARRPVMLSGVVERVEPRTGGRMRLILHDLEYKLANERKPLAGKFVWTWWKPDYTPAPGQSVTAKMRLVPVRNFGNPGSWDYAWFWKRQGVLWRGWLASRRTPIQWGAKPDDWLWRIKFRLRSTLAQILPDNQGGALVRALISGDRSGLEHETTQATRCAGLAHVLALSGLHVGFVAFIGMGLAWLAGWACPPLLLRIPRPKLAVLLATPLVVTYTWLGQPSQSLIRAAIMFGFWGFLLLQGRGKVLLDGLFFALATIILVTPFAVFDLSLQMSATAVAGIGLIYPLLREKFIRRSSWWTHLFIGAVGLLAVSVCANIALLPLISRHFGTLTPNILMNLIWLPVLGCIVMPLGLIGMVLALFSWTAPFGASLLVAASVVTEWLLKLLHVAVVADLTPVFSVLGPLWPEIIGYAVLLIAALIAWAHRKAHIGLAGIGFFLLVWPHWGVMFADTRNEVRLSAIDVGLGQALVVSTPGGHRWLIDGGMGTKTFDFGESVVAPYLTLGRAPRLDGIFMSHPDADHSHGLSFILSRFAVGGFYTNGMMPHGRIGRRFDRALEVSGIQPVTLHAGQVVTLDSETRLEILHPSATFKNKRANERSLIMRLTRNGKGLAVIPGDVEQKGIKFLLESGSDLAADVLVVPHHGSKSSYSPSLYVRVAPQVAVCSNGYINRYGFPHDKIVEGIGVPFFPTSRHGLVSCIWDNDNGLSVQTVRP